MSKSTERTRPGRIVTRRSIITHESPQPACEFATRHGGERQRELRRRCPEAHIVLVSGQPMHLLKARCADLHIDACVRKPFTLKALTEALPVTDPAQVASVPDTHVQAIGLMRDRSESGRVGASRYEG